MKKTLITLAALAMASVAMAETDGNPWNNVVHNLVNPTDYTGIGDPDFFNPSNNMTGYTMVFIMDADVMESKLPTWGVNGSDTQGQPDAWFSIKVGGNSSVSNWKHEVRLFKGGDGNYHATLYVEDAQQKVGGDWTIKLAKNDDKYSLTFSVSKLETTGKLNYTLGTLAANDELTLASWTPQSNQDPSWGWDVSNLDSFAFKNMPTDGNGEQLVEHMMVFNEALDKSQLTTVVTAVIPEPTTATLSLLALAGLAARRRRK